MLKSKETLEEVKLNDLFFEVCDVDDNNLFDPDYFINQPDDSMFTVEDAINSYNTYTEFLNKGE